MKPPFDLGNTRARDLLDKALAWDPQRLDLAALAIAALEFPGVEVPEVEATLEELSGRVKRALPARADALQQVQSLRRVLVDEENFRGNAEEYDNPENSFLNVVLERRVGLPISLAVVYLEVARRAEIPLYGVSFPGHFVVARDTPDGKLVLDPFHQGDILTQDGCEELLRRMAPQLKFTPSMISPAPVKTIAYRMLTNLKRSYLDRGDGDRALKVVDLMLRLAPDHPGELRARAAILSALGAYRAALADIERCLELSPQAPDHQNLLLTAKALRQRVEFLN